MADKCTCQREIEDSPLCDFHESQLGGLSVKTLQYMVVDYQNALIAEDRALRAELEETRQEHRRRYDSLFAEAAELAKELERLRAENRWIPVEQRLPEHDAKILVAYKDGRMQVAALDFSKDFVLCRNGYVVVTSQVTHWRPLPGPPEVKP